MTQRRTTRLIPLVTEALEANDMRAAKEIVRELLTIAQGAESTRDRLNAIKFLVAHTDGLPIQKQEIDIRGAGLKLVRLQKDDE